MMNTTPNKSNQTQLRKLMNTFRRSHHQFANALRMLVDGSLEEDAVPPQLDDLQSTTTHGQSPVEQAPLEHGPEQDEPMIIEQ